MNTSPLADSRSGRGVFTFLFTDIVGSTRLWEAHPEAMRSNLERHDRLVRAAIVDHGGHVFKTVGDAFYAVFSGPQDALAAAVDAQLALAAETWIEPAVIQVRMAVHTGQADTRDGDYFGSALNRVARLLSIGHGGQVLMSKATVEVAGTNLPAGMHVIDLGEHRLRDLAAAERVSQLGHPWLQADLPPLRSLSRFPTNLPPQLTAFVGREKELAEIEAALLETRLLTLTGSGGSGKTRLSLHAAADAEELQEDGVWLVELAPISDPALVARTVADAAGVAEAAGQPALATLTKALAEKRVLLILDNCEHVLDSAAELAQALLRDCPGVRIIATSRESLGISGERVYRVPSLSLPDLDGDSNGMSSEAVRLFVDRARAVRADFTLTGANAVGVATICRRVDGIPLAIELAAARVRAMSVEQIDSRLRESFRLLAGGSRSALPRQQTLQALIDWSHDLLGDPEKILLRRLSVFAGGWTLEAAEAVAAGGELDEFEVLDRLTSLVDKSLVVYEDRENRSRYRLLETVRQYARERLIQDGEATELHRRHAEYFAALAERAGPELTGPNQVDWFAVLDAEIDNMRAALDWCADDEEAGHLGLRVCYGLMRYWYNRGHLAEGQQRCRTALAHPGAQTPNVLRAAALSAIGILASEQANHEVAVAHLSASLELYRAFGDLPNIGRVCNMLGMAVSAYGEHERARGYYEEALATFTQLGNKRGIAVATNNIGNVFMFLGRYQESKEYLDRGLALITEFGDSGGRVKPLCNRIRLNVYLRDFEAAARDLEAGVKICVEAQDKVSISEFLTTSVGFAAEEGRHEVTAQLLAVEDAHYRSIGMARTDTDQKWVGPLVERVRQELGEVEFERATAAGRRLTLQEAIELALRRG